MKKVASVALVAFALPFAASAETWKNAPVVDTQCISKVKTDPDKHTVKCAVTCAKNGYGLIASDGTYLKFDTDGNAKTLAALKGTKKTDHIRATIEGERQADQIKVKSLTLD